ncbi:MAG TPA: N-acetyl-gamma-glutamyl-phosphate reductase, partial [Planctomycetota bacterium]|nr:N-acetyl-gamma-glutamyl-phosphate reductase [Planctomycetota bacterium]
EVRAATSRDPGKRVDAVHRNLRGLTDLRFSASEPASLEPDLDAVFLALPHGESKALVAAVRERCPGARIYDLAQDFRTGYEPEGWVYGLPEAFREEIKRARTVACPGCFATAILLGTFPALAAGLEPRRIIVDAKTGSSGSGASPAEGTHHPTRVSTFRAYKVMEHQHETEIKAVWGRATTGPMTLPSLTFVPQSAPLVRGIYACCYLVFEGEPPGDVKARYRERFAGSRFVRVLDEVPNVRDVAGTNNADLFVKDDFGVTLVIVAIDNLVKGASGQAVQCMNLGFGLAEDAGLRLAGLNP